MTANTRFVEDFASFERSVLSAPTENRLRVFQMVSREGIRWHTLGEISKPDVIDRLAEIGRAAGLADVDIQSALVDGVQHPFDPSAARVEETPASKASPPLADGIPDSEERPPAFSDDALALRAADRHAGFLRFVDGWSRWMTFDGCRWEPDTTRRAVDEQRKVCREAAAECEQPGAARAIASAKTVAAVGTLERVDRRIAATTDQWDNDPWLLNTPGGIIDLRTGHRQDHDASFYLTHMTAVGPAGACPTWLGFLDRVMGGDLDLGRFLQRVAGYALTGSTAAHALFFLHGHGANGKSVFINTISGILGDYHRAAPIETFTASSVEQHPTALAGLRGARLVTAVETEEGRRWAEARIKTLTGGDKIAARFMRQDFFEFFPQFKLVIAGNHKPGLRSVDEAIRRRFNLIPFAVTIPAAERDETLTERLRAEWPGILAWMIAGCIDWQTQGLAPPLAVTTATAAYLDAEDALSAWIDETCERDAAAWSSSSQLFASWKSWTERSGEHPGSAKRFAQLLDTRGFPPLRRKYGRGFEGLRILPKLSLEASVEGEG